MHARSVLARAVLVSVLLLLGVAACSTPGSTVAWSGRSASGTTEILWDEWGVPHIFASSPEELFFAHGWAQARDHGNLLLRLLGTSRGRAAEYWGEAHLDSDRWVHTVGIPERAEVWYTEQDGPFREYLDSFCRGINAYCAAHADRIDDEMEVVLPVAGVDILAHSQRAIHFTFIVNSGAIEGRAREWSAGGSNAWAIAPKRSASGNAVLVANPHLPWSDLFTWHEAQLASPEVDVYGASLVGSPFLGIAFNDYLGWTHTVNTHDGADLYELTLADDGYRFDGEVRSFEVRTKKILIRGNDGALRDESITIRRSVHGPVVASTEDKALALRVVGLEASGSFRQYWDMATAENLAEFEAALRQMQTPMFTVMYADRDGHILHFFGGETPVRSEGSWEDWSGSVPGVDSSNLWTAVHSYDDLPRVIDPASGWLQNANDPPWTTTFPRALDADDYPPYMAPRFMHLRAQRSARMLFGDEPLTFEQVVQKKLSTRMELADRILDDLEDAVAGGSDERAARAMRVLREWDRSADAESRGAVLFARFARHLFRRGGDRAFALPWSVDDPANTPDGLADPAAAVDALRIAAEEIAKEYGTLDVAWGDVHRLRMDGRDFPANGGPGDLGIFRVVGFSPDGDGRLRAGGGDSYVAVIEFSDPVRARALLSYGNASQPKSPHRGDQLELFSRKELRPVWRERAEIEAHLEEREDLSARVIASP